ncbi:MAG: hypothetical protein WC641_01645 [Patescibacteria group bacterium]
MNWKEFVANNLSAYLGGDVETHDEDVTTRGPLKSLALNGTFVEPELEWCAKKDATDQAWRLCADTKMWINAQAAALRHYGHDIFVFGNPIIGFSMFRIRPAPGARPSCPRSNLHGLNFSRSRKRPISLKG